MIEAAHSNSGDDDDQSYPPSPLAGNVRLLKAAVYIMGVMLVVGTIVLILGIIWKASQLPAASTGAAGGFETLDLVVPSGAAVRSVDIGGARMAVTLEGANDANGDEIVIIDLDGGEVLGRIRLKPGGPAAGEAAPSP